MSPRPLAYAIPLTGAPGPVGRFLLSPVGWPLHTAALLVAATAVCAWSGPSPYFWPAVYAVYGAIGVGLTWLARAAGRSMAARHFGRELRADVGRRLLVPAVLAVTVGLVRFGVPASVAFRLSRPAMERAARVALANPKVTPPSIRLGCYGVCLPRVIGSSVYFTVGGRGLWNEDYGYAYRPSGPPRWPLRPSHLNDDAYCRPVGGSWYEWCGGY